MDRDALLDRAADAVRHADALLIGSGAGMGVDSGLPDFRGNEGFWKAYPAFAHLGLSFVELANPRWFETDPTLVEPMLEHLVRQGGIEAIEALIELRRERLGDSVGEAASARARAMLEHHRGDRTDPDEGRLALVAALLHDLGPSDDSSRTMTLRELTLDALDAFATLGASSAHLSALTAVRTLETRMGELERCDLSTREGRIGAFRALHEIDVSALETDSLTNLLLLGARGDEPRAAERADVDQAGIRADLRPHALEHRAGGRRLVVGEEAPVGLEQRVEVGRCELSDLGFDGHRFVPEAALRAAARQHGSTGRSRSFPVHLDLQRGSRS